MADQILTLVLAGDLILDEPDPGKWLSGIAPALRQADLAIGHLEVRIPIAPTRSAETCRHRALRQRIWPPWQMPASRS
jgi:hypothetical protein